MKENFQEKQRPTKEEIEEAKLGFERMARRLDELWQKDKLTPEEKDEERLILNNAAHIDEMLRRQENQ